MFSVIERYISREIFQTLMGVLVVLLLIFVSNRLVRYLADAASGDIPSEIIFTLLGLKAIKYFIFVVPLAMFLAVLLSLGRMYRDSEMAALASCGVGVGKIYKTVLIIAIPGMILLAWISLKVVPLTAQIEYKIIQNAEEDLEVTGISAGRFRETSGGKRIIYVESVSKDKTSTKNVFIHAKINKRSVVFSAAVGRIETNEIGERLLILEDGYRYDGEPGKADYRMTRYKEHAFKLVSKLRNDKDLKQDAIPTSVLWNSKKPQEIAELQWRISLPIFYFLLALSAIPIGRVNPRKGRYGKLIFAMLFYIMYFILLNTSKVLLGQNTLSPYVGLWWVHIVMFGSSLLLLSKQLGFKWVFNPSSRFR